MGNFFSGLLGLGMNNENADMQAQNAINETNDITIDSMDQSVEDYSEDTVKTQQELIDQGYSVGDTGADGRMGPKTRMAVALRDKDNARTLLEQEQLSNKEDLLSEGRTGMTQDAEGWKTPVYSSPFNRFG
jgi:hypothetical protein